jgi:bifunctional non-homologous end joining protein LigD
MPHIALPRTGRVISPCSRDSPDELGSGATCSDFLECLEVPIRDKGDFRHSRLKHDGFRIIARKKGGQVRLYSRPGNDLTHRFPLIAETLARLRSRSCIIDGEAVACDENGVASFDLIRNHRANGSVFLHAFDLIELNGGDLRQ